MRHVPVESRQHEVTAERAAKNDARFRRSNEELAGVAKELDMAGEELLPFLCECADVTCTKVVQLSAQEYEAVRQSPVRFINARGHEEHAHGWAKVVDEFDRYTVVEKVGEAARIVAELDPRTQAAE